MSTFLSPLSVVPVEANRGDEPCVTLESPCEICASFSEEPVLKIKNRKRYVRKQKADTSKDDELDLLGDKEVVSFTGSQADLEGAADYLFASCFSTTSSTLVS